MTYLYYFLSLVGFLLLLAIFAVRVAVNPNSLIKAAFKAIRNRPRKRYLARRGWRASD